MKFLIVWRKEGSIVRALVEGESHVKAYEEFVKTAPGGGLPVKPTFHALDDENLCCAVENAGGRSLAVITRL